jgi:opacity protein-like surface antigen
MGAAHRLACIFLVVSLAAPAVAAAAAPAALMNKSITISFNATGDAKSASGQVRGFTTQVSHLRSAPCHS